MKSGEKGLIGPGNNGYDRKTLGKSTRAIDRDFSPVTELTPDLADKIFNSHKRRQYDAKVSKEAVLHHLKQLKAQMGKERKQAHTGIRKEAIRDCMEMIDKKIAKVNA